MAKPAELPRWAQTALGVLAGNISDPVSGQKDTGFVLNQTPTSGNVNWFWNTVYQWIKWVDDGVWTAVSLVLTTTLAAASFVATGAITGGSLHFTAAVSTVINNTLAFEVGGTVHTKAVGGMTYNLSANPIYWPLLGLQAGDTITQVLLDFQKVTSGGGDTITYDIVKIVVGVESSATSGPSTQTGTPGFVALSKVASAPVAAGTLYYFKVIPANSTTGGNDRSFDLNLSFTR